MDIPGYKIERELGRGGMATVYLATQEALSRLIALKVVAPALAADSQFATRFLNEGKYVAQLSHPNIITIFDCGSYGNYYYLSMEYLPGGTLEDRIDEGLSLPEALEVIKAIASALGYAHSKGFIHRDVKPLNILFRKEGTPVLTDFGVAKFIEGSAQLTTPGMALGSLRFMSPEQVTGQDIDSRSDLYSLGIVFFKMLTGRLPFEADDPMVVAVMHSTAPIPILSAELAKFQPVIDKLLAKDPNDRFQKAEHFIQSITRIQRGQTPFEENISKALSFANNRSKSQQQIPATREVPRLDTPKKRGVWLGLTGGGLMLVTAAVAYVVLDFPLPWSSPDTPDIANIVDGENSLERIAAYYQQQAEQLLAADKLTESLLQIDNGLRVSPEHPGLLGLRDRIREELAQESAKQAEIARRAREIEQGLAKAEQYMERAQFTDPPDSNAYQIYQRILELDPGNEQARDGLMQIAEYFRQQALQAHDNQQWQESLAQIDEGLKIVPEYPDLLALRKEVQEALDAEQQQAERQRQIEKLLADADNYWQQDQLTQPTGENAYENYQQVLRIDAQNAIAQQGLERLARHFLVQAEELQQQGELENSLTQIEKGLVVIPRFSALTELREQVKKELLDEQLQRAQERRRQETIKNLLVQAEQYLQQTQLTQPPDNNAYAAYQQVLELDPDNSDARQGLASLVTYFQEQAQQSREQGQFEESLKQITQGLQVEPENSELLALRKQVQQEWDARRASLAEEERRRENINQLLAQAEQYRQQTQLTQPPDNNAYAAYQQVLELDPDNTAAKQGLAALVGYFQEQAQQKREQGEFEESLNQIAQGLQVEPDNSELLALREQVQQEWDERRTSLAEKERQERRREAINQLLAQTEQQLATQPLTLNAVDNAYEAFNEALKLDPENTIAKSKAAQLGDAYRQVAEQQRQQGDFQDSLASLDKGLVVAPEQSLLLELRREVEAQFAEAQEQALANTQQQKINQLLAQAQEHLERLRLTLPAGNNAYETYQQILQIDPQNEEAKQGFSKIADRYQELAERYRQRGDFSASLNSIDKGLNIVPEHPALQALRTEVQASLAEAEQQRRAAQRQRAEEERRRQAEAERRRAAEEEARRRANTQQQGREAEARRQAEEERRRRAAAEQQRREAEARAAEQAEQRRRAELARQQAEEAARRQAELERQQAQEERRRQEQENNRRPRTRIIGTF